MSEHRIAGLGLSLEATKRAMDVEARQHSYGTDFVKYLDGFRIGVDQIKTTPDFIDIRSDQRDDTKAIFVHQPLGNPLKVHRLVGVASIADMFPGVRVVSFSNSGHPGCQYERTSAVGVVRLALGNLTPYMHYINTFAEENGIAHAVHVGESLGADLATEAGAHDGYESIGTIALDPASTLKRTFRDLTRAFNASNDAFRGYLHGNTQFLSATAFDVAGDGDTYGRGLIRPTNVAMVRMLSRGLYLERVKRTLANGADIMLVHGTDSELCTPESVEQLKNEVAKEKETGTLFTQPLDGARHAFPNDLALVNALIGDTLEKFTKGPQFLAAN